MEKIESDEGYPHRHDDWDKGVHFSYDYSAGKFSRKEIWICPEEQEARKNPVYPDSRQEYINMLALLSHKPKKEWSQVDIKMYFVLVYYIPPGTVEGRLKKLELYGFIKERYECFSIHDYSAHHYILVKKGLRALSGLEPIPFYGRHSGKQPMAYREPIPNGLRHEVFERDNYRCVACGLTNKEVALTVDHKIPVFLKGTNDLDNLQTMCFKCNIAKNNKLFENATTKN